MLVICATNVLFPVLKVDCCPVERESTLTEREQDREPMSAVERETTMRNLVDMQRKVEQRQQRDRERQLLKVRKRWTESGLLALIPLLRVDRGSH